MKKLLGITLLLLTISSFGQGYAYGDNILGVGLGIGSTFNTSGASVKVPPILLYYEAGIHDHIAVGGFLGFSSSGGSTQTRNYNYKYTYNYTIIGARGAYHFGYLLGTVDNFDLYGGLSLGYAILSSKIEQPSGAPEYPSTASNGGLYLGAYAGARYYFNSSVGVFGEIGYSISVIQVGAVFKL